MGLTAVYRRCGTCGDTQHHRPHDLVCPRCGAHPTKLRVDWLIPVLLLLVAGGIVLVFHFTTKSTINEAKRELAGIEDLANERAAAPTIASLERKVDEAEASRRVEMGVGFSIAAAVVLGAVLILGGAVGTVLSGARNSSMTAMAYAGASLAWGVLGLLAVVVVVVAVVIVALAYLGVIDGLGLPF